MTPERVADLERFAGEHGKFRWCACMRWRLSSTAFRDSDKQSRLTGLVDCARAGAPVGVLGYVDGVPMAWCAIAPRADLAALQRSRVLAPVDDAAVWSVVCFFIDRHHRRRGATRALLEAAVRHAADRGATIVEGYPVDPDSTSYTYMGSPATFAAAGFEDVTPPGRTRRVYRRVIG